VALMPESVLDVVGAGAVVRHKLPRVLSEVVTPLIWRSTESTPAVDALRALLTGQAPRRLRST
jgi:hypothetical protein